MSSQAVAEFLGRLDAVIAQGQLSAAEHMVDDMLDRFPDDDELLYRKFRLLIAQRKIDDAFVTSLASSPQLKTNPRVNCMLSGPEICHPGSTSIRPKYRCRPSGEKTLTICPV